MADVQAESAGKLDPAYVAHLNAAITAGWEAAHKATGGDVATLLTVCCELLARPVAALYSAGETVDLQSLMGHVFSRAHQIMAQHDGPLIHRQEAN
jgi:hypothetical protein